MRIAYNLTNYRLSGCQTLAPNPTTRRDNLKNG